MATHSINGSQSSSRDQEQVVLHEKINMLLQNAVNYKHTAASLILGKLRQEAVWLVKSDGM